MTTTEGVRISGSVHGEGPPLVLLQGVIGDGDLNGHTLLPYLTGQFTCYLPSRRGRDLSGDRSDRSFTRLVHFTGSVKR